MLNVNVNFAFPLKRDNIPTDFSIVLCFLFIGCFMCFGFFAHLYAEKVSPCCVSVSSSMVVEPLKAFRLQERSPPCVKAVILETEKGTFCIDPNQAWVQKKIEEFRRQQKTTVSPTSVSPHDDLKITSTYTGAEKVSSCCVSVSSSVVVEPLKSFRLQKRNPPCIKAVILETEKGHFCIDPNQAWVQKKIEEFRRQQKMTVSPTSVSPHDDLEITSTYTGAEKVSSCCVSVSSSVVVEPLKSFRLQKRNPPCIKAVILETEKGTFCIDPNQAWVQKKIEEFRRQQKMTVSPTSVSPHDDLEITSTYTGAEKVSSCCVSVSSSVVVEPLKSFRLQKRNPPCIKAVILETEKGHFCIDPRQPWLWKKIEEFRRQQKMTVSPTSVSPHDDLEITSTYTGAEKVSSCCVSVSSSVVVEPLKAFRLQERNPPCVKAVILETEKGHFCIDPNQAWVQKKIEEFRRQQKMTVSPTSVSPHDDLEITSTYIGKIY
ncbi:uncharacterized protein LOC118798759 isoform X2 [Colossoma macropomum]|uniref:uncharacterized protein LOC118798759 isoform X2 n=1 Tax=Colossoma macropomum TaxID=42526 RepID=UPI001863D87F|nr:uncharacterized protein LOC118798759 isoform X2 [Colossoma macropomum]